MHHSAPTDAFQHQASVALSLCLSSFASCSCWSTNPEFYPADNSTQDLPNSACCLSPAPGFTSGNRTCLKTEWFSDLRRFSVSPRTWTHPVAYESTVLDNREKEHGWSGEERKQFVSDDLNCLPMACYTPSYLIPYICPLLLTVVCRETMSPFHFIIIWFFLIQSSSDLHTQCGQRNSS